MLPSCRGSAPTSDTASNAPRGCGIEPVLDTLVYLKTETDVWFEVTTWPLPLLRHPGGRRVRCPPGSWGAKRQPVRLGDFAVVG